MADDTGDLLPEGLQDRLPGEAARFVRVMRTILDVMDSHGYDRVDPPLIEFERSFAGRMEGVETRRMFRFVDPASYRTLALRSDITPQVGRIAATSLAGAPRPLRLCYAGPVVTMRGAGLDPARERSQLGAELIGSDSVAAAAEVVLVAVQALEQAGAKGISVDFTMPDLVDTLAGKAFPLADEQIEVVRRELDAKDAGGLKEAGGEAYLPLLYATGPFEQAIATLAEIDAGGALASRIAGLKDIANRLGDRARVTLDPTERHGFEYQTWFGFTLYADGVRGALGRGGTYRIAGKDEAATGFSLYPDALAKVVDAQQCQTLFLPLGHDPVVAADMRAEGWRTIAAMSEQCDAKRLGCTHVLKDGQIEPI